MGTRRAVLASLALLAPAACIAPSVVDSSGRAVVTPATGLAWGPVHEADLDGLFESVLLEGDAAFALRRVYYCFSADGTYTGAALVDSEGGPAFQTLSGRWRLQGDSGLDLGDGQTVEVQAAPDHLRLVSLAGTAVLRRVADH